jgi:5-formyltetrahydrofolate cyclo-ligase
MLEPAELDLILVPCVGADPKGFRIGYGGGFYDRYLFLATKASTVILCRESLMLEEVPAEPHDLAADIVVTDTRIIQ